MNANLLPTVVAHVESLGYARESIAISIGSEVTRKINQHATVLSFAITGLGYVTVKATSKTVIVVSCNIPPAPVVDSDPADDPDSVGETYLESETIAEPIDVPSVQAPTGWDCVEPEFPNAWNAPASPAPLAIGDLVKVTSSAFGEDGTVGMISDIRPDSINPLEIMVSEHNYIYADASEVVAIPTDGNEAGEWASGVDQNGNHKPDWTLSRTSGVASALASRDLANVDRLSSKIDPKRTPVLARLARFVRSLVASGCPVDSVGYDDVLTATGLGLIACMILFASI